MRLISLALQRIDRLLITCDSSQPKIRDLGVTLKTRFLVSERKRTYREYHQTGVSKCVAQQIRSFFKMRVLSEKADDSAVP